MRARDIRPGQQLVFKFNPNSRMRNHEYNHGDVVTVWEVRLDTMTIKTDDAKIIAIEDTQAITIIKSSEKKYSRLFLSGALVSLAGVISGNPVILIAGCSLVIGGFIKHKK